MSGRPGPSTSNVCRMDNSWREAGELLTCTQTPTRTLSLIICTRIIRYFNLYLINRSLFTVTLLREKPHSCSVLLDGLYFLLGVDRAISIGFSHLVKKCSKNLQVITHINAPIHSQELFLIFSHRLFKSFALNNQVFILLLPANAHTRITVIARFIV